MRIQSGGRGLRATVFADHGLMHTPNVSFEMISPLERFAADCTNLVSGVVVYGCNVPRQVRA